MRNKVLSAEELKGKGIPYSPSHRSRLEYEGKFPRRVRLGIQRYGYLESEIDEWLLQKIAARDEGLPK